MGALAGVQTGAFEVPACVKPDSPPTARPDLPVPLEVSTIPGGRGQHYPVLDAACSGHSTLPLLGTIEDIRTPFPRTARPGLGRVPAPRQCPSKPNTRRARDAVNLGNSSGGGASRLEATPGPVLGKSNPEDARPDTPRLSALSTPDYEPLGAGAVLQSPRKDGRSKEGVALHADREVLDMRPAGGDLLDGRSRL